MKGRKNNIPFSYSFLFHQWRTIHTHPHNTIQTQHYTQKNKYTHTHIRSKIERGIEVKIKESQRKQRDGQISVNEESEK